MTDYMTNEEAIKIVEETILINEKISHEESYDDFDRFIINQNSALKVALKCLKICSQMNAEKILEISDAYLKAMLDITSRKDIRLNDGLMCFEWDNERSKYYNSFTDRYLTSNEILDYLDCWVANGVLENTYMSLEQK